MISWLPILEKELRQLEPHPDFRLWLTSEPHPNFPIFLARASLKVAYEVNLPLLIILVLPVLKKINICGPL